MEKADIERLAIEARFVDERYGDGPEGWNFVSCGPEPLLRFAALIRAKAMEDAAAICEARRSQSPESWQAMAREQGANAAIDGCVAAIRAAATHLDALAGEQTK